MRQSNKLFSGDMSNMVRLHDIFKVPMSRAMRNEFWTFWIVNLGLSLFRSRYIVTS
jgi:hypothetical protein